ncbi:hypothetical protein [Polymorphospora sp. NPDC050346]|uniref:hypothetical protein n=1 Tax=Polymorphospora sp. NPDC050346 TaxID=3155780 RepID=UPI0033FE0767
MSAQPATGPTPEATAGLPAGIAVGDEVISWYDDEPVIYGGPGDGGPFTTLRFAFGSGRLPTRLCEPDRVAPVDTPIPDRDERIVVEKRPTRERPYGEAGVWRLTLPGTIHPTWHRTKRDAVATGLRRLAIRDWHATTRAAPDTFLFRLPTTGYLVLQTAQVDGEEPREATSFIDAAGRMDDAAAVAYVTAELASLANAPRNVLHTWRLVHRTDAGDRTLLTPAPFRGTGEPLLNPAV